MSEQPAVSIRRYAEKDGPAVRALFIQVNRELAPSAMRDQFELYIARALREEIDRIEAYYAERKGSFWIAEDSTGLLGTFGLERVDKGTAELRRMYVAPRARRCGIARMMLEHAERVCRDAGYDALVLSTVRIAAGCAAALSHIGLQAGPRGSGDGSEQQDRGFRPEAVSFREAAEGSLLRRDGCASWAHTMVFWRWQPDCNTQDQDVDLVASPGKHATGGP